LGHWWQALWCCGRCGGLGSQHKRVKLIQLCVFWGRQGGAGGARGGGLSLTLDGSTGGRLTGAVEGASIQLCAQAGYHARCG
jgi:hypothetical protein